MTAEGAAAWEAHLLKDETAVWNAMNRAGRALADAVELDLHEVWSRPRRLFLLVLAGKGHNAGDALIAANELLRRGTAGRVEVVCARPRSDWKALTARAASDLEASHAEAVTFSSWKENDKEGKRDLLPDVVIDGLVGMQFRPPLNEPEASIVAWSNELRRAGSVVCSVDLPSGLAPEDQKGPALEADFSYATGIMKTGLLEAVRNPAVGRLRYLDIGFFDGADPAAEDVAGLVLNASYCRELSRLRPALSDKRNFGTVMVLAGSPAMPGAALMTASAAIRAGAGNVRVCTSMSVIQMLANALPEAMWLPAPIAADGSLDSELVRRISQHAEKASALVMGPGLLTDRQTIFLLARVVREIHLPLVIDASALQQDVVSAAVARPAGSGPVIITPHEGEMQRLLGTSGADFKIEDVQALCRKYRLTCVLKGAVTRLVTEKEILYAAAGGPVLARGGSGDVFAGILGTLLAQHSQDALEAACLAISWQGTAADLLARERGATSVRTTDILDYLSPAMRKHANE